MLKQYEDSKEKIKNLKTSVVYWRFQSIYKIMLLYCLKYRKSTQSKNPEVVKTEKWKNNAFIIKRSVW